MVATYPGASSEAGDGLVLEVRSGGRAGSRPVAIIEAENP